MKVLIVLEGGIVQDVLCDGDGLEVLIKDRDWGQDPDDKFTDPAGEECYYRFPHVETLAPETVSAEFAAANTQMDETSTG